MAKKYFGTDGIRGTVNSKNINGDMFFKFGLATGTYFKTQKKKETDSNNSQRYKVIRLHSRTSFSIRTYFCWNARLYAWTHTYKWLSYVNESDASKYGYYDNSIS
tara:strand:+ start:210 stop:524 length:315 start_codon:yes stop_codon:yes gene_type:complete